MTKPLNNAIEWQNYCKRQLNDKTIEQCNWMAKSLHNPIEWYNPVEWQHYGIAQPNWMAQALYCTIHLNSKLKPLHNVFEW